MRVSSVIISPFIAVMALAGLAQAQFTYSPATSIGVGQRPDTIALGDFDGNGFNDIAVTTDAPDKVDVLFNVGGGTFGPPVSTFLGAGTSPQAIESGDFDGDGDMDLVVALDNTSSVVVLLNNGAGVFTQGASASVGTEPRHMASGDLDGDGDIDVVTSNRRSNDLSVLLNNGNATFAGAVSYAAGNDPRAVALGDYDGNGSRDIAVSAHDDRAIRLLRNNGAGAFTQDGSLSTGAQLRPDGVVFADLDGDLDMDLASGTSGNALNMASVFLNMGGGLFGGRVDYPVGGQNPGTIVAGDFDLDGDRDLATVNQDSANVSLLPNSGAGTFGGATILAVGLDPDHLAAGDLTGNGGKDLVTADKTSNTVSFLRNTISAWTDLGLGLAGSQGIPSLEGRGPMEEGAMVSLILTQARPLSAAFLVIGNSRIDAPLLGGTLVPSPDFFISNLPTDATGSLTLTSTFVAGIPAGLSFYFQMWIADDQGPQGFSASNGLQGITQ